MSGVPRMKPKLLIAALVALYAATVYAQTRTWFAAVIPFDASGNPKFAVAATGAQGTPRTLANTPVNFDASGFPKFVLAAGTATPTAITTGDGTCAAPAWAFTSEATTGFFRNGSGDLIYCQGSTPELRVVAANVVVRASTAVSWTSANADGTADTSLKRGGAGMVSLGGPTIGAMLKADALPTVASGFGTSPAITALSTPLAGSVNVGTGGVATTGTINFNGTAFPSAPFCIADSTNSNITTRVSSSTTQLTLTTTTAWSASDVLTWLCVSSK